MSSSRPPKPTPRPSPSSTFPTFPDPIPGILPFGSVNLFGGASGVGKTTMGAPLAAALRSGTEYFGRPTNPPTGIYYLAADRDWRTYGTKFTAARYPDIPHYALPDDPTEIPKARAPRSQFDLFERCMRKLDPSPGGFVFVDPIAPTFIRGDQNRAWDAATAMHHFRWVARAYHVTLLCFSNVVKERTDAGFTRARDRISGSGAFGAYSDTQWYLLNGQSPMTRIFGWAPREEAEVEYVVRFNADTILYEYESGPWDVGDAYSHSDGEELGREQELLEGIAISPQQTSVEAILRYAAALPQPLSRRACYRYLTVLVDQLRVIRSTIRGQGLYTRPAPHMRGMPGGRP